MKKFFSLFLVVLFVFTAVGCSSNSENLVDSEISNDTEIIENEDTYSVIKPLKQGIDLSNIEDSIISLHFNVESFDIESKTLTASFYERDIYDAVEISNMKVGDSIIVEDKVYPIDKITKDREFIDINDGYTYSEFGMTFMPYEGGTYRTLLLDDYSTYSKIGDATFNLSEDFVLTDYEGGEPDNDGVKSDLTTIGDYFNGLSEWSRVFGYSNTVAHIVDNEIVSIDRYWVP